MNRVSSTTSTTRSELRLLPATFTTAPAVGCNGCWLDNNGKLWPKRPETKHTQYRIIQPRAEQMHTPFHSRTYSVWSAWEHIVHTVKMQKPQKIVVVIYSTVFGVSLSIRFIWCSLSEKNTTNSPRQVLGNLSTLTVLVFTLMNLLLRTTITLHPFNGLFSRITWVSWHQKGKPFWILQKQEIMG